MIHSNVVLNAKALTNACEKFVPLSDASIAKEMASVSEDNLMGSNVFSLVRRLWADEGAQQTWARRSEFQILDSFSLFMNELDMIEDAKYIPTVEHILWARVRTNGIVEESYKIDGMAFVMFDVGGQRNERKKWIHCFDGVTAVIFVAAISEYDQFLYEDDQMHRMDESILLFDEVCNERAFRGTSLILFLNKNDLFREKLKKIPIRVDDGPRKRYVDFEGPFVDIGGESAVDENPQFEEAYKAAKDYFLNLFVKRNQQSHREIYHHTTCATDSKNIKFVFGACKDIIFKGNLRGSGFMD